MTLYVLLSQLEHEIVSELFDRQPIEKPQYPYKQPRSLDNSDQELSVKWSKIK